MADPYKYLPVCTPKAELQSGGSDLFLNVDNRALLAEDQHFDKRKVFFFIKGVPSRGNFQQSISRKVLLH